MKKIEETIEKYLKEETSDSTLRNEMKKLIHELDIGKLSTYRKKMKTLKDLSNLSIPDIYLEGYKEGLLDGYKIGYKDGGEEISFEYADTRRR